MKRHTWTDQERDVLRAMYPEYSAAECSAAMGLTVDQVQNQVHLLGLRKSREWIAARARERSSRPDHGGRAHQFGGEGFTPWNKGMKGLQIGGKHSRFKAGQRPHTWRPVGHEVVRDGQLWRKVTDEHRGAKARFNFVPVAVLVWTAANGPVPKGHVVRFRDGMATTVAAAITLDRLELVTRAEHMRRNSIHNYPEPVVGLIRAVKRAERALEKRK